MQFWTFNFSTNPEIPYIYNINNFPLNFRSSGDSIFLQIWTFRIYIYIVYNFPLNFRSSGYSIFLQIQTFCSNIIYKISSLIYVILDIQFLSKSEHSVHLMYTIFLQTQTFCTNIMYTIFFQIYAILDVKFFCKSRHSIRILYTISC